MIRGCFEAGPGFDSLTNLGRTCGSSPLGVEDLRKSLGEKRNCILYIYKVIYIIIVLCSLTNANKAAFINNITLLANPTSITSHHFTIIFHTSSSSIVVCLQCSIICTYNITYFIHGLQTVYIYCILYKFHHVYMIYIHVTASSVHPYLNLLKSRTSMISHEHATSKRLSDFLELKSPLGRARWSRGLLGTLGLYFRPRWRPPGQKPGAIRPPGPCKWPGERPTGTSRTC